MDSTAIILLIIVLGSVAAWFIAARKLKAHVDDGNDPKETSGNIYYPNEATAIKEVPVNLNTVYQNHVNYDVQCCPFCDGENPKTAAYCGICGTALR